MAKNNNFHQAVSSCQVHSSQHTCFFPVFLVRCSFWFVRVCPWIAAFVLIKKNTNTKKWILTKNFSTFSGKRTRRKTTLGTFFVAFLQHFQGKWVHGDSKEKTMTFNYHKNITWVYDMSPHKSKQERYLLLLWFSFFLLFSGFFFEKKYFPFSFIAFRIKNTFCRKKIFPFVRCMASLSAVNHF